MVSETLKYYEGGRANETGDSGTGCMGQGAIAMNVLGRLLNFVDQKFPNDAKSEFFATLNISESLSAQPAGHVLIAMHILEMMGFMKHVDSVLGEIHISIEEMKASWKKWKDQKEENSATLNAENLKETSSNNKGLCEINSVYYSEEEKQKMPIPSPGLILGLIVADMMAGTGKITPAYKYREKAEEWETGPLLGIEPSVLNKDRIVRTMSAMGCNESNMKEVLFSMLVTTIKEDAAATIPLNSFLLDTTVLELDGTYKDSLLVEPGRGTNSYSQIILSLVIANGSRIPVDFDVLPGGTSDSSTLESIFHRIHRIADPGCIEFIMDRGYPTASNILFLQEQELDRVVCWISPLKMGVSVNKVRELIDTANSEDLWEPIDYRSTKEIAAKIPPPLEAYETTWILTEKIKPPLLEGQTRRPKGSIKTVSIEVRCVFYRHTLQAEKDRKTREEKVNNAEESLLEFDSKLNKWTYTELDYCKQKLHELLTPLKGLKKYLTVELTEDESGTISMSWSWDTEGLAKEANYDGIFGILTNHPKDDVDDNDIITRYRGRNNVEINIKELRGLVDLERVLYRREERIHCIIFLKVIASIALLFMKAHAQRAGIKTTVEDIQHNMGNIRLTKTNIQPVGLTVYGVANDTELNKYFREAFSLPDPVEYVKKMNEKEASNIRRFALRWYRGWLARNRS